MAFVVEGPEFIELEAGGKAEVTYRVVTNGQPQLNVCLVISGLPVGVTASFQPSTGRAPFDSILTLSSAADSETGKFTLNVTAWDIEESKTMPIVFESHPVISGGPAPSPSVVTNTSSYDADETMIVTVNGGSFGLYEWVVIYDSTNTNDEDWNYLNSDSKTVGGSPVSSYPVTVHLTAPSAAGTYHVRFFGTDDTSTLLADSTDFMVGGGATFVPDYYAAPSALGSGTGLSAGNAFQIHSFWAVAAPGVSLGLTDGTYTGTNGMINPGTGVNGSSGSPITIRAINDGLAKIDGQGARLACNLINNSWFVLQGIDFCNGSDEVMNIGANATNNIIRRCCVYDGLVTGGNTTIECHGSGNTGNLFEDVAIFGNGRKSFEWYGVENDNTVTLRRVWTQWSKNTYASGGPKMAYSFMYNSCNPLLENCIGTYDLASGSSTDEQYGVFASDRHDYNPLQNNIRVFGCISYLRSADNCDGISVAAVVGFRDTDDIEFRNCVSYVHGTHSTLKPLECQAVESPQTRTSALVTNFTTIATTSPTIGGDWTTSNNSHGTSVGAVPTPFQTGTGTGARVCFRYVDGTLTSAPLWPWPMDARIRAALTASGRSPDTIFSGTGNGVTEQMEAIFGTIPAG